MILQEDAKMHTYVNQYLSIEAAKFLIIPNCGKGDCLFKAISQAVFDGSDKRHIDVREAVVKHVISKEWDHLKEDIEFQHVQQNESLLKAWTQDPLSAYRNYMTSLGALGSLTELAAAARHYNFNFVTIQQYDSKNGASYRVENCNNLDESQLPLYYFFFTGDFDNGHWEYLHPVGNRRTDYSLTDGTYYGRIYPVINGEECSLDNWLKIHTENTNNPFDLKCNAFARIPASTDDLNPFDSEIQLEKDGMISLLGGKFRIHQMKYLDLFSVITSILFKGCDEEGAISQLEVELLEYRIKHFSSLNDKLTRQPYSNGFNLANLKYLSMPSKGNLQDLLAASCLREFSFTIYFETSQLTLESCTYVHPDRWEDKPNKMLYFFMKLDNNPKSEETIAKWWHLVPDKKHSRGRDLNENFLSGGSSSETIDKDDHVVRVGKISRKSRCPLKITKKQEFTRSASQQTEITETKDDLSEELHSNCLNDTSTEEKERFQSSDYYSSSGSESCMEVGTTIVESYCNDGSDGDLIASSLTKKPANLHHTDRDKWKPKTTQSVIWVPLPDPSQNRNESSIETAGSDASLLNPRSKSRSRKKKKTHGKKSLWRTFIQKCLPCTKPQDKQDAWFKNK